MMETIPETFDSPMHQDSDEEKKIKILDEYTDSEINTSLEAKKPTETENHDDKNFTHFDAFTDVNNQIYRTYQLRKNVNKTSRFIIEDDTDQSSDYEEEKKTKQVKEKEYKCCVCSFIAETKLYLTLHMRKHISKNSFTCLRCQDTFDTNNELLEHKKTHNDEEKCYVCNTCEKAFSNELTFIRHGFNHIKNGPFKCPECLETSTDRKAIQYHISHHFDTKNACKVCKTLVPKHNMASHLKSHDKVKCEECGKICSNKGTYEYHLTSHTGVKLHQCLYCGRGFSNGGQKNIHMKLHTGEKLFECKICFQKFTQQSTKDKHELTHNKEKNFQCDLCSKKFKNKAYMKYHLRLHYNDKPYQCPSCPLAFVTSTHLISHTYITHMAKLFKCEVCDMDFSLKKSYARHLTSKTHQKNAYRMKIKPQDIEE